jgi:putative iron-regulated protein
MRRFFYIPKLALRAQPIPLAYPFPDLLKFPTHMTRSLRALFLSSALGLSVMNAPLSAQVHSVEAVTRTYADVAAAMHDDALNSAQQLQTAVNALLEAPSEATLNAARAAWVAARVPYQQTEAFRFGNAIVDDGEGRVNA